MLTSISHGHLVGWIGALSLTHKVVILVRLVRLHILNARVYRIVLFLSVSRVSNILCLARGSLEITALVIEVLEH